MKSAFTRFNTEDIKGFVSPRRGEIKVGEAWAAQTTSSPEYLILGVAEDIGVRANYGREGAAGAFASAMYVISNYQSNALSNWDKVNIYGCLEAHTDTEDVKALRADTGKIDDLVSSHVSSILELDATPIIIGGGHNNAYPILKAVSSKDEEKISVINIDAHADLRELEGRHSGNGFSYARAEGYLDHYHVYGINEKYLNLSMSQLFDSDQKLSYTTGKNTVRNIDHVLKALPPSWHEITSVGLEIDLDVIAHFPSSASHPLGFNLWQIIEIVDQIKEQFSLRYVHICEGAPSLGGKDGRRIVGRTIGEIIEVIVS